MNCLIIDHDSDNLLLLETYIHKSRIFSSVVSCASIKEAERKLSGETMPIDLLFLGMERPTKANREFLSKHSLNKHIILLSSSNACAMLAFDFGVIDVLQKPLNYSRFLQAMIKVRWQNKPLYSELQPAKEEIIKDSMLIKVKSNNYIHLRYNEIQYIQAEENYAFIFTDTSKHTIYTSLIKLFDKLPKDIFIRVHRSFIINKNKLLSRNGNMLLFKSENGTSAIPIGVTYASAIMDHFDVLEI